MGAALDGDPARMSRPPSTVVVTGIGVCAPVGLGVPDAWDRLLAGASGVAAPREDLPLHGAATAIAPCPAADRPPPLRVAKHRKYAGRATACALHAVHEAIAQAGWTAGAIEPARIAIHGATGQTGLDVEEFFPALGAAWADDPACDYARLGGPPSRLVDPHFSLRTLSNAAVALVASELEARGASNNFVQGETAGAHALRAAWHDLREDRADLAVVFACDSLPHPSTWLAYERVGLLSRRSADLAPSPFDRDRDGLVLGEGGAALVLERAPDARRRGVAALAQVAGVEVAAPVTTSLWNADASALAGCMARAWRRLDARTRRAGAGGTRPCEPALVVARGLATLEHDAAECAALAGAVTSSTPIAGVKGATGYLGAATAVVESVFAIRALLAGLAPPVARLVTPDAACGELRLVRHPVALRETDRTAIVLSAGWGGDWAAVALRGGTADETELD
jgi:3-oxoacyl-(acyl-carrier-protein) synthase